MDLQKEISNFNRQIYGNSSKKTDRTPIPTSIKKEVLVTQKYKCAKCKTMLPATRHFHHKKPVSKGGKNTKSNIVALCPNCHSKIHHDEQVRTANRKSNTKSKRPRNILDITMDDLF